MKANFKLIYSILLGLCAGPFVAGAVADTFGSAANSFDIDFVTIGNPGNPPDANPVFSMIVLGFTLRASIRRGAVRELIERVRRSTGASIRGVAGPRPSAIGQTFLPTADSHSARSFPMQDSIDKGVKRGNPVRRTKNAFS